MDIFLDKKELLLEEKRIWEGKLFPDDLFYVKRGLGDN